MDPLFRMNACVGRRLARTIRLTVVASLICALMPSGLRSTASVAAADGAEIRATGEFTTAFVPGPTGTGVTNIVQQNLGDLSLVSRYSKSTFIGNLEGFTISLQNIVIDDVVARQGRRAYQTNIGSFIGALNGVTGSFSTIIHLEIDRSGCDPLPAACPAAKTPLKGSIAVVPGSGLRGLEGICGGGSFESILDPITGDNTQRTAYDFTFRFGADCKVNNR